MELPILSEILDGRRDILDKTSVNVCTGREIL
jgi:hypothetical protein